jgi:hypothetical protein
VSSEDGSGAKPVSSVPIVAGEMLQTPAASSRSAEASLVTVFADWPTLLLVRALPSSTRT